MTGPLQGIRVLDLTQVLSGPFATMLLSDMGAEVIKVEKPGLGDTARGNGPFVNDMSTYFCSLNRGKKSITIDLSKKRGTDLLFKLSQKVDILVENFTPITLEKLGIGYNEIVKHNPDIIYAAGSGFGLNGKDKNLPAFDIIIQAMGGVMSITGEEDGSPVRPGVSYGDISAALFLCIAILAALQERHNTSKGQLIDISMLDCQATVLENAFTRYLNTGEIPRPLGTRHPLITPFQLFQTKSGYISVALRGGIKNQWPLFCSAIDHVELIDDPRFTDGWKRTLNYKTLEPILSKAFKTKTTVQWLRQLKQLGIPCGSFNTIPQASLDRNLQDRNMFIELKDSKNNTFKVVNNPFKFSRTTCDAERMAPELGEHTELVLNQLLLMSDSQIAELREAQVI